MFLCRRPYLMLQKVVSSSGFDSHVPEDAVQRGIFFLFWLSALHAAFGFLICHVRGTRREEKNLSYCGGVCLPRMQTDRMDEDMVVKMRRRRRMDLPYLASCSIQLDQTHRTTWLHPDALPYAGVHRVGFTSALNS
jgi:hypothetical protein